VKVGGDRGGWKRRGVEKAVGFEDTALIAMARSFDSCICDDLMLKKDNIMAPEFSDPASMAGICYKQIRYKRAFG